MKIQGREISKKKQPFIIFILQPSKENLKCAFFELKKISRFLFWTFQICPKMKMAPTLYTQNVSSFFLVPFFQRK